MFGKRIAVERGRLGLTQKDLAERLGIGRSGVGMLETDRSPLLVARVLELEQHGFDPYYLITGERKETVSCLLMNWELLQAICRSLRDCCSAHGVSFSVEKETLILKLLYERFAEKGTVDEAVVELLVRVGL